MQDRLEGSAFITQIFLAVFIEPASVHGAVADAEDGKTIKQGL